MPERTDVVIGAGSGMGAATALALAGRDRRLVVADRDGAAAASPTANRWASGLRQVHELVLQLRGRAGERQVAGSPQIGFAQVYGAPGTAAVTILSR